MINSIDNTSVYTDSQGLAKLKMQARDNPDKALEAVARQFEALFTQTLLKSMRDTSMEDGLFDNDQSRLYQDLFDKQMATDLSSKRGLGLADVLIRQLGQNISPESKSEKGMTALGNSPELKDIITDKSGDLDEKFESPDDYLKKMLPLANTIEKEHGIPAVVILAQSALETGWGKHIMTDNNGRSSHNLFGIKADSRWNGVVASTKTIEYKDGIAEMRRDNFRSYDGFMESMADYAQFLKSSPRYKQVLDSVSDPGKFTAALQQSGYATDPQYATKINKIMDSLGFESVMNEFKDIAGRPLS